MTDVAAEPLVYCLVNAAGIVSSVSLDGPDHLQPAPAGMTLVGSATQPWPGQIYDPAAKTFANPAPAAPTQADLVAYASRKHVALRDGGITVNVGTAAAPIVIDVASDAEGDGLVGGNIQYIGLCTQAGQQAPTFNWKNNPVNGAPGTKTVLSATQMASVGLALRAFIQATYDALDVCDTAIVDGAA